MSITEALEHIGIDPVRTTHSSDAEVVVVDVLPGVTCAVTWRPSRPRTYTIDVLQDGERLTAHSPMQVVDALLTLQVPQTFEFDYTQEV